MVESTSVTSHSLTLPSLSYKASRCLSVHIPWLCCRSQRLVCHFSRELSAGSNHTSGITRRAAWPYETKWSFSFHRKCFVDAIGKWAQARKVDVWEKTFSGNLTFYLCSVPGDLCPLASRLICIWSWMQLVYEMSCEVWHRYIRDVQMENPFIRVHETTTDVTWLGAEAIIAGVIICWWKFAAGAS